MGKAWKIAFAKPMKSRAASGAGIPASMPLRRCGCAARRSLGHCGAVEPCQDERPFPLAVHPCARADLAAVCRFYGAQSGRQRDGFSEPDPHCPGGKPSWFRRRSIRRRWLTRCLRMKAGRWSFWDGRSAFFAAENICPCGSIIRRKGVKAACLCAEKGII